jgi:hypothetical protein
MKKFHGFCVERLIIVLSSVFDKTRQDKKLKNIKTTLLHLETPEDWFECRQSRKYVTYAIFGSQRRHFDFFPK